MNKKFYPDTIKELEISTEEEVSDRLGITLDNIRSILSSKPTHYVPILIPKDQDEHRSLHVPDEKLKEVQKRILTNLLHKVPVFLTAHGGVKKRSIITHAQMHINKDYVLTLDIKNFFPSVHWKKIRQLFTDLGCEKEVAEILCSLTTFNNCIPQGAPTSPYLSNLILWNLDKRLYLLARENGFVYTRYFDDIAISGSRRVGSIKKTIYTIIDEEGYSLKEVKERIYKPGEERVLTGIIIKDENIHGEKFSELHSYLISLRNEGLVALKENNLEKEKESLKGKISFIKSVNKEDGKKLEKIYSEISW